MKVSELREELELYGDDKDVIFEINDDIECESWTEDKFGNKKVSVDSKLTPDFMCSVFGDLHISLIVGEDEL